MGPRNSSRKGTGSKLPANATRKAIGQEMSRFSIASGMAPRSSDMGAAAVKKTWKKFTRVITGFSQEGSLAQSNKLAGGLSSKGSERPNSRVGRTVL